MVTRTGIRVPHSWPIMGTSTTTGKVEASPSTKRPVSHQIVSHVSLIDYTLSDFPTSLSRPTIQSTTRRQNPTNGCTSTLSPSSWQAAMMTSKYYIFPWHSTLCLSPGLIDYEPAPLILWDSFGTNSVKNFAVSSPTQVLRMSLELASRNQMKPSSNIIAALLSYEPKSMISQTGR